jgi:L-serine/L-threonine ammonia-lyase
LSEITGAAKSLGAKTVAQKALDWAKIHPVRSLVVSDSDAIRACARFADDHRCLVEPACGASLAAAYDGKDALGDAETAVVIVCGGIGVDLSRLQQWMRETSPTPET